MPDPANPTLAPLRVLWLTREEPFPPKRGDLFYAAHLMTHLAAAGAQVTVVTRSERLAPGQAPRVEQAHGVTWHLVPFANRSRAASLASSLPSDPYRISTPAFRAAVRGALAQGPWDAIVLNHVVMGWALELARTAPGAALVYVSHNHEMSLRPAVAAAAQRGPLFKLLMKLDGQKNAALERRMVQAADLVTAITDEDADLYRADFPAKAVQVLLPGYAGDMVEQRTITADVPRQAVLLGTFDWTAKQHGLSTLLAAAHEPFTRAGIRLDVIGKPVGTLFETLAARHPFVTFSGFVPDLAPHFAQARIGIMPDTIGGGFKHKSLQYVMHRVVLATIASQAMGLPLAAGQDMVAADTPAALAEAVAATIDDLPSLNAMQERAFARCRAQFDWAARGRLLHQAIAQAVAARHCRVNAA
ncbi:glycosyltransferase [Zavarzinia sp. CC-PAN008]|uniref:glycosyltransferase n=1 Tax=Zavarzinia sp. CC-PAN008 TaxID=3243332 RepID=UPI003F7479E5